MSVRGARDSFILSWESEIRGGATGPVIVPRKSPLSSPCGVHGELQLTDGDHKPLSVSSRQGQGIKSIKSGQGTVTRKPE
jgi:hypothetical protein